MTSSDAIDRIRAEFVEMPGLELTLPQASRLWGLGVGDCRRIIDALVACGFLKWTMKRTVLRASVAARQADQRFVVDPALST
jgi:hypothetical protein